FSSMLSLYFILVTALRSHKNSPIRSNIELVATVSISNGETNLKGMKDEDVIKWAKENNFDTILTADYNMAKNVIAEKLNVLFLFQENHIKFILARIYPIKGWIKGSRK
ncbi:MAG: hypothetical protein ACP6IQ_07545, partial [Candidatus Njordarchaeia archaeon]